MCDTNDNHQHARIETWITPETSEHLSAKMVHLFPGDSIAEHTTGPGREEVLIVLFGTIAVQMPDQTDPRVNWLRRTRLYTSGETVFIPANTPHAVSCSGDFPAQYAYIVTKKRSQLTQERPERLRPGIDTPSDLERLILCRQTI